MSPTVCAGFSAVSAFWNTIWMRRQLLACALGSLRRQALAVEQRSSPRARGSRPAITRASVVLPQPDSPMTPSAEPRRDREADIVAARGPAAGPPSHPRP